LDHDRLDDTHDHDYSCCRATISYTVQPPPV
jgi:hypothetical protein